MSNYNNKKKLYTAINKWLELNEKMAEINKYLYEHTELFESNTMNEFKEELYHFFAGKINQYTRRHNELLDKMTPKMIIELNENKLFN